VQLNPERTGVFQPFVTGKFGCKVGEPSFLNILRPHVALYHTEILHLAAVEIYTANRGRGQLRRLSDIVFIPRLTSDVWSEDVHVHVHLEPNAIIVRTLPRRRGCLWMRTLGGYTGR
jgi:hypothetical protein